MNLLFSLSVIASKIPFLSEARGFQFASLLTKVFHRVGSAEDKALAAHLKRLIFDNGGKRNFENPELRKILAAEINLLKDQGGLRQPDLDAHYDELLLSVLQSEQGNLQEQIALSDYIRARYSEYNALKPEVDPEINPAWNVLRALRPFLHTSSIPFQYYADQAEEAIKLARYLLEKPVDRELAKYKLDNFQRAVNERTEELIPKFPRLQDRFFGFH